MSEMSDADYWRIEAKLAAVERERDEARAEVEQLRRDVRAIIRHWRAVAQGGNGFTDTALRGAAAELEFIVGGRVAADGGLPSGADTDTRTHTTG